MIFSFSLILHWILILAGGALLLATLPLSLELLVLSLAAALPPRRPRTRTPHVFRLAVIVPAHDEESLITACVRSLLGDGKESVEVFVVAHRCKDRTAERAKAAGARVLSFNGDPGKGSALHYGLTHALNLGADAVLVIDADSVVSTNLLASVSSAIRAGADAVQTRYQVANEEANFRTRLAALSFLGMNVLRPRGRSRIGLSCGIFGNGFALSADVLRRVPYTANSVVEDLEYHLRLIAAGVKVEFLDGATVFAETPQGSLASQKQRGRWEGGRKRLREERRGSLVRGILRGDLRLIEPLLDLLAQPVATQAAMLMALLLVPSRTFRLCGLFSLLILALYVIVSAMLGSTPWQTLKALAAAPGYLFWKLLIIPHKRHASRRDATWVRTKRNDEDDSAPSEINLRRS